MNERHLEESLNRLRVEIGALRIDDANARRRLDSLVIDIGKSIDGPRGASSDPSLADRIKASMLVLETSHPRLAVLLNDVLERLSAMGV